MSGFSHQAMQTAVYQLLSGDATLAALISDVYDYVPADAVFPYIAIGEAVSRDWSTKSSAGSQSLFVLHAYSIEGGRKQVAEIMRRIYELLHQGNLSLSGHSVVAIRFEFCDIGRERGGEVYHGRIRFRAYTEEVVPA